MTSDVITLPDDRRLSWHEFGDPDGAPVFISGDTGSGLGGASYRPGGPGVRPALGLARQARLRRLDYQPSAA